MTPASIQIGSSQILKAFLGNTLIYQKVVDGYNPLSLFTGGKEGVLLEFFDIATLFQDAAGTVAVTTVGDPIALAKDKSGNKNNAVQTVSSKRPVYSVNPSRITLDKVDDEFVIKIPTGGWVGTMVVATTIGTASYEVNLTAGNFLLGQKDARSDRNIVGVALRNGAMTEAEKEATENYFVSKGAVKSFVAVTNMYQYWHKWGHLTSFPLVDTSNATNLSWAWFNCTKLTNFPIINVSKVTTLERTWQGCTSLTSFPLIDTSNTSIMYLTWFGCSKLTSFPLLNTSKVFNLAYAWSGCTELTSFPLLNTVNVTIFEYSWQNCTSLTSFPALIMRAGRFAGSWQNCTSLADFPANMFNNITDGYFEDAFINTALTQTSIDNILTSLVTSGIATGARRFAQSGGSAPSITGKAAIDALRSRGWTVTVTGGY